MVAGVDSAEIVITTYIIYYTLFYILIYISRQAQAGKGDTDSGLL